MYTKKQKIEVYAIFLLILYAIQIFTFFTIKKAAVNLYLTYQRPIWALPLHWIVPVWYVLYTLIGISGAKIWLEQKSSPRRNAIYAWIVIIILDLLWPIFYLFISHPPLTLILISLLFVALFFLLFNAFLVNKTAGYLLIPFTFMVLYELVLHWTFYILNA